MQTTESSQVAVVAGAANDVAAPVTKTHIEPNSTDSTESPSAKPKDPMLQLSSDPAFHYELLRVMSMATYEGADIGEVLVAATQIKAGDFESYYTVFHNLAERVNKSARAIDARRHPVSARTAFFRASSYYRSADFFLHGNWSDPRINETWDKQLAAFDAATALLPVPGQRINLTSAGDVGDSFTIPAIFFGSGQPSPRPTLLLFNGYDGAQEEMYHYIGQAAIQRGMNVITFEGPGQPTVRRTQNLGFIPNWEKVVTPVVDYALTRPEVDGKSIGLLGMSFGGVLAPRAAAFEPRIAAVLAADGIYDFGAAMFRQFPAEVHQLFQSGDAELFDSMLEKGLKEPGIPTTARWGVNQGTWSFNVKSPFEWLKRSKEYTMEGLIDRIKVPVFVGDVENESFFPGQAQKLAEALGEKATHYKFLNEHGAGEHCSVGAGLYANQVMLDWFEDVVAKN